MQYVKWCQSYLLLSVVEIVHTYIMYKSDAGILCHTSSIISYTILSFGVCHVIYCRVVPSHLGKFSCFTLLTIPTSLYMRT